MLDRSTVDRLRNVPGGGAVISVYLGLSPDPEAVRAVPTRVKALLQPLRDRVDAEDVAALMRMAERVRSDVGPGAAFFAGGGLEQYLRLPARVRERVVVDDTPYLGPLQAVIDHFRRFCAVVLDRRDAWIYRFHMGELETWEQIGEEEVRKDNYGGFGGYDEPRVRGHAEAVARRLFRAAAARLAELYREGGYEMLLVGGQKANVAGLVGELPSDLLGALAGTFTIDPGTASPSEIRLRCRELVDGYEQQVDLESVRALLEAAGSGDRAVLGFAGAVEAANQRAISELLVEVDDLIPGLSCRSCGWLDLQAAECPACGGPMRELPDLVDALAERTRAEGGAVRYLMADTDLGHHGVGATLRFPVPVRD